MTKSLRLKRKYINILIKIIIIILIGILAFSVYKIVIWLIDTKSTKDLEKEILTNVVIQEINIDDENEDIEEEDYGIYSKFKNVSLINVDISSLKKDNNDTVGWLQVPGTDINYPFVQTSDNNYYLKHDFLKNKRSGGWIFLDYRNNIDNLNSNNIIYGHQMKNKTMFGTLLNVIKSDWLNNEDYHIIKVSTEKYNYLFQVFSVYSIPSETYYIQTDFATEEAHQEFIDTILKRSVYNFETNVTTNDKVLTLSTCYSKGNRLVLHSKLIRSIEKD